MAKSKTQILMDFNKANKEAEKLEEIAGQLMKAAGTDLENGVRTLQGNWKSDNASDFIRKVHTEQSYIKKEAREMAKAAEALRKIAKNTYDAEMKALEIAKKRTYK